MFYSLETNMLTHFSNKTDSLLEELESFDLKYQDYLRKDGRWLIGGFKSIVSIKKEPKQGSKQVIRVKMEVFNMLPAMIREDLSRLFRL